MAVVFGKKSRKSTNAPMSEGDYVILCEEVNLRQVKEPKGPETAEQIQLVCRVQNTIVGRNPLVLTNRYNNKLVWLHLNLSPDALVILQNAVKAFTGKFIKDGKEFSTNEELRVFLERKLVGKKAGAHLRPSKNNPQFSEASSYWGVPQ